MSKDLLEQVESVYDLLMFYTETVVKSRTCTIGELKFLEGVLEKLKQIIDAI
jgi:hypothetical protein